MDTEIKTKIDKTPLRRRKKTTQDVADVVKAPSRQNLIVSLEQDQKRFLLNSACDLTIHLGRRVTISNLIRWGIDRLQEMPIEKLEQTIKTDLNRREAAHF